MSIRITVNAGEQFDIRFRFLFDKGPPVRLFRVLSAFEGVTLHATEQADGALSSQQILTIETSVTERPDAGGYFTMTFKTAPSSPTGLYQFKAGLIDGLYSEATKASIVP